MAYLLFLILEIISSVLATSSHQRPYHPQSPHLPHPTHPPHYGPFKHSYCDPLLPPSCAYNGTNVCLEDKEYPTYEVKGAIESDYLFLKKYADIPKQSADDLVDLVSREQEEYFDYSFYTGASKGPRPYDITHWGGPEGYICPSQVIYATPRRARNVEGHWRVIVNHVHYYTQTTRMETCLYPDSACRVLAPCYKSKCTQKFVYHRLLSFDQCNPYKGLFIDIYRLPSACSCHVEPY